MRSGWKQMISAVLLLGLLTGCAFRSGDAEPETPDADSDMEQIGEADSTFLSEIQASVEARWRLQNELDGSQPTYEALCDMVNAEETILLEHDFSFDRFYDIRLGELCDRYHDALKAEQNLLSSITNLMELTDVQEAEWNAQEDARCCVIAELVRSHGLVFDEAYEANLRHDMSRADISLFGNDAFLAMLNEEGSVQASIDEAGNPVQRFELTNRTGNDLADIDLLVEVWVMNEAIGEEDYAGSVPLGHINEWKDGETIAVQVREDDIIRLAGKKPAGRRLAVTWN